MEVEWIVLATRHLVCSKVNVIKDWNLKEGKMWSTNWDCVVEQMEVDWL